jgi:hypothetical protein
MERRPEIAKAIVKKENEGEDLYFLTSKLTPKFQCQQCDAGIGWTHG